MKSEEYYKDGELYYSKKDFCRALISFEEHFKMYGDNDSLNYIGCCHLQLNQIDNAKNIFQELINTVPDWARPVFNLGRVYVKLGKYLEALEYYNKALEMNQEDDEIYYYIGVCYSNNNDYENAIAYYKKAVAVNYFCSEVHLNLGLCYVKEGMLQQAIEEFEIAYTQDEGNIDALFNKAMVFLIKKEYIKAIDIFLKLYGLQPDNIENMIDIAKCYLKTDNLNCADEWISKILAKDSANVIANKLLKVLAAKRQITSSK